MDGIGWASLVAAIALLINQIANALPKFADARKTNEERKLVEAETVKTKAETTRVEAEERRLNEENTGRFLSGHDANRAQVDEAFKELRKQLAEANARTMAEFRRAEEIEASRSALWDRLQQLEHERETRKS